MSNIEKAAETIGNALGHYPSIKHLWAAQALADAGLLMPELPQPLVADPHPLWKQEGVLQVSVQKKVSDEKPVTIWTGYEGLIFTPDEARQLAYALLAAANHTEGEQ